ncbi:hypothetical protein BDB01DRAFT_733094 [Pilobolus umbonatus]|nr:hypothetical protein BDB01DRAFT_733094 [Pilobolus umbonatus]
MFQLAVISGKIVDLDSYLLSIVDEIKSLGEHGLIVKKCSGEVIKGRVHMVMATGGIPQVSKFAHHKGHRAKFGCRICSVKGESSAVNPGVMYYRDSEANIRPVSDFVNGNEETKIVSPTIFASLPTFCGSSFFGLDEMHLLGQGIGRFVLKLIVPKYNVSFRPRNVDKAYTFFVDKKELEAAGHQIKESQKHIPTSFQGSWDNLIQKVDGARAIDFIDFLLYVIPTLIVPLLEGEIVKKVLLSLVRGCSIALQWDLTESLITEMQE